MSTLQKIGVVVRRENNHINDVLTSIHAELEALKIDMMFHQTCDGLLNLKKDELVPFDKLADCDACIVIGGDGTFLEASRALVDFDIPIIGVNMGRLGFLVDISPEDVRRSINDMVKGKYTEEQRFLFKAEIEEDGRIVSQSLAANDVVISNYQQQRMIELETIVDGRYINSERADGLIVSTPTGSTAYALSSGGPIIHPALNVLSLVPICPHSLNHRPLVISADSTVEIVLDPNSEFTAQVSFDGQGSRVINPASRVRLTRHSKTIRILHPTGYDYFGILRAKLNWGKSLS